MVGPPPGGATGAHRPAAPLTPAAARAFLAAHTTIPTPAELARRRAARARGVTLNRVRALCAALGHPQSSFRALHVAGTNGKTSTTLAAGALLSAAGMRAGTFTSPHEERVAERIRLGAAEIGEQELAAALSAVAGAMQDCGGEPPGFFEILTVAALWHFATQGAQVAAIEAGIGGRPDATGVLSAEVAVVTSVGLDHTELLGDTLEQIAADKATIAHSARVLVVGPADPGLLPIFDAAAAAECWQAGRDWAVVSSVAAPGGRVVDVETPYGCHRDLVLPIRGDHQAWNLCAAIVATEAFCARALSAGEVSAALAGLCIPGRLEVLCHDPLVVVDGAKNVQGAVAASAALTEVGYPPRRRILVVGLLAGRRPEEMLLALGAASARLVVSCTAPSPRALPASAIATAARGLGIEAIEGGSLGSALALALDAVGTGEAIVVAGSLSLVGPARRACGTDACVGAAHQVLA